jgi:hypothetical protein
MVGDIEFQFRVAVEALSHWVKSAPISHSNREWKEQYTKLNAEVRRLSMKRDQAPDKSLEGAAKAQKLPPKA